MAPVARKQLSIKLTRFFLRVVGFWVSTTPKQKLFLDIALTYSSIMVVFAIGVLTMDLYYSRDDFYELAYSLTNIITMMMVLFKFFTFAFEREKFIDLIKYSKENFWDAEYDEFGNKVLEECEKKCVLFVFTFTTFAQGTAWSYMITPIIDNIGRNETDRKFPFNIWLDIVPYSRTPYFEILFFIEALSLYHSGICYFCFDNLLCILNIHVTGQFRILNHRFETLCDVRTKQESCETEKLEANTEKYLRDSRSSLKKLEECIKQHQSLIRFVDEIEAVYRLIILGQVLLFSILICLVSYQAFLVGGPLTRRIIFLAHSSGTFTQLFMFTLTCHELRDGSIEVADAIYKSRWHLLPGNNVFTRKLRKNLILILMRTRRPCCLTAFGFFPITLETFMTINSTAVSYLTLLRQSAE
uniref:Odorant receptor n=1 Tax=Campoletis chlorideae TaxID=219166 RepID=A0A346D3Y4_9HYME|nr:odorant receptor [Campoletis chlorideae]